MNIGTYIYTWIFGNFVGKDEYGNKYYSNIKDYTNIKGKRWVVFQGKVEATKIPSHWHAWLHKSIDVPPLKYKHKYDWQKNHKPNMTGTKDAYFPSSHPLSKSYNSKEIDKDYESWTP